MARVKQPRKTYMTPEQWRAMTEDQQRRIVLEGFARKVSEEVSMLVEYDQEYWHLLPDYAVRQLEADVEALQEFLADFRS